MTRFFAPRFAGMPTRPLFSAVTGVILAIMPGLALLQAQQPAAPQAPAEQQPTPIATPIQMPNLPLGLVTFPNGKAINLNVGMGSALFRQAGDPSGRVWMLTDRGPNVECAEARRLLGIEADAACPNGRNGRIYPLPGFAPSIYGVDIGPDNVVRVHAFLPLKGKSGRPVSGRPPAAPNGKAESAFGIDAKPLPPDPSGIDPEALIRLADGSFWIGEEFGPSLLHVQGDGTILKRIVPAGTSAEFRDADYEVVPALPAIMGQRANNRGIEGLAISPDERFLYVMMQGALANPDAETARRSRHVRIFKLNRETMEIAGQYLYQLEDVKSFAGDNDPRERPASAVMISEMVAIGEDRLLVQERVERTSRIFAITLDDESRVPSLFNNPDYGPSLEQIEPERLALRGLAPLTKALVFDTDQVSGLPSKIEGMAVIGPNELLIVNDNDFGLEGVRTQMFRVTLPQPIR